MFVSKIKIFVAILLLSVAFSGTVQAKTVFANAVTDGCNSSDASKCICPTGTTQVNCNNDPVFNQTGSLDCTGDGKPDPNCTIITKYLNPFIRLLSIIAGLAVTIGVIFGGIQYSSAGGDPQKIAKAKMHIRNSIIALLVFLFLYAILRFLIPGNTVIVG